MVNIKFVTQNVLDTPGEPWDGSNAYVGNDAQIPTANCQDILFALENVHTDNGYYPVSCDFTTLTNTGMVFFQNPNNLHYDYSTEVLLYDQPEFTTADIEFIFAVETGFVVTLIGLWTIARNLRKISPYLFG